ncbi:MAG TPA: GDP-mannose 4,6-dehydratase [Candidatus Acidoferrales bacterium]|nr:GDP-mannose 4,6-dehydratase [Candidatus Acidoferrales bacterium]
MTAQRKRVLLTGGAGFIGSHVAQELLRRNAELTIVDNLDRFYSLSRKKSNLAEIRKNGKFAFASKDIRGAGAMRDLVKRVRPDAVIHLAARAGVRPSIEQPLLYERVNIGGTVNLLEVSRQYGVEKFIFGSSSSVYGMTSKTPFSEAQGDLRPVSPYGATKLAGEALGYTYAHLYSFPVICLRFFTVYGPRQRPDLAIHKFTALIEQGKPLPIFGDGSTGRDYTYVDDIVSGVMAALDYEPPRGPGPPFEIFNLGNSHPVTLAELVGLLEEATGRRALKQQKPLQLGDVLITWADISKSARVLGYRPATRLDEGLKKFVVWFRSTAGRLA